MIGLRNFRFCNSYTLKLLSVSGFAADTMVCDALNGEGSSVYLFCIYCPQQENGGLVAYRSRLFNMTRAD